MRQVATTADGQHLFVDTSMGGGGGAGMSDEATVRSVDHLYLQDADGRFVPLTRE
ncbi:hypothetical protein D3C87_1979440 [compost metagenome]